MNFGTFAWEVKEICNFALCGRYLFGTLPPDALDLIIVNYIPLDGLDAGPDGKCYDDLTEDESSYRDIRSEKMVPIFGELSRSKERSKSLVQLENVLDIEKLRQLIRDKLPNDFGKLEYRAELYEYDDYIGWIIEDMVCCGRHRLAFGKKEGFWEDIFAVYQSGGMPVGWSGQHPEGRLMAIYPGFTTK